MTRINVSSSNLSSVGFENGILEIQFHNDKIYQYFDVPESKYHDLITASSKGTFFSRYIKNVYRCRKL
jgi:hypothetical protein